MIKISLVYGSFKHETMAKTEEDAYHAMTQAYMEHVAHVVGTPSKVLAEHLVKNRSVLTDTEIKDDVGTEQTEG